MSEFAKNTSVSVEKSRAEIERTVQRYGAQGYMYATRDDMAVVQFEMEGRVIRFRLELPSPNDRVFTHTEKRGTARSDEQAFQAWEQACRQRWRALLLVIKAKLEAVESGISVFDEEFLAWIVGSDGCTLGESLLPALEAAEVPSSSDLVDRLVGGGPLALGAGR